LASIDEIGKELGEEFAMFDDPMDRYEYLIELGQELPVMKDEWKTDNNVVKGCQSTVWLHADCVDGVMKFHGDSNTVITKGIIALLIRTLSEQKAQDIVKNDLAFIDAIGLRGMLTSQRSNGLSAMVQRMKLYALGYENSNR